MTFRRLKNRLLAKIYTALPSLASSWGRRSEASAGEIPWAEAVKPLSQASVALVTTGGLHLIDQPPFDMANPDGDATWREIPVAAKRERLTITHDYYDHGDADKDLELIFPVKGLGELVAHKVIGSLFEVGYAFMGHIEGEQLDMFKRSSVDEVARKLAEARVDYALLVPA